VAAALMLARYPTSLQEDEALLARLDALPPRLQAAVVARGGEKRCLAAMRRVRGGGGVVGRPGLRG
jgi:hypothetical protein